MHAQSAIPSLQMLVAQYSIPRCWELPTTSTTFPANWKSVMQYNINRSTWQGEKEHLMKFGHLDRLTAIFLIWILPTVCPHNTLTKLILHLFFQSWIQTCFNKYISKHQHSNTSQLIKTALLDSIATSYFNKPSNNIPTIRPFFKEVAIVLGQLPKPLQQHYYQWCSFASIYKACTSYYHYQTTHYSVLKPSPTDYVTMFHASNDGATMHRCNDITIMCMKPDILQGCQHNNRCWYVPVLDPYFPLLSHAPNCIHNVCNLPSTKYMVCHLNAALGFSTKATLLSALQHGNLTTFVSLTATNVAKQFHESDKTKDTHMKQTRHLFPKFHLTFLTVYWNGSVIK